MVSFDVKLPRTESFKFKPNSSLKTLPKQLQIDEIHKQHSTVEVLLKAGKSLAIRDSNGFSDPYCVLYCQRKNTTTDNKKAESVKSSTQKKNLNPVWNEVFDLSVECDEQGNCVSDLIIECWDHDLLKKDDFLGSCTIDLTQLEEEKITPQTVELCGIETGHLEIELIAHHFGKKQEISGKDRYAKTGRAGKGGEGVVFTGTDKLTNKQKAIKKIICQDREEADKVIKESTTISKLNHPHIVSYDDIYEEENDDKTLGVCLVMQYFEKGDLGRHLKLRKNQKKRPTLEKTVKFSLQISEAVWYLHQNRIMHRDLKPENVFMSSDYNSVHLGDFGFKRDMERSSAHTVLGSVSYLAPEVAGQQKYSWKADIYSLGCVMYEIATLDLGVHHNFQALSKQELYFKDIENHLITAHKNEQLAKLIVRMLQIKPEDRPTAEEVVTELRTILSLLSQQ